MTQSRQKDDDFEKLLLYYFNLAFCKRRRKSIYFCRLIHSMNIERKGIYTIKIDSKIFDQLELEAFGFEMEDLQKMWSCFKNSEEKGYLVNLPYFYLTTFTLLTLVKSESTLRVYPGWAPTDKVSKKRFGNLVKETLFYFEKEKWIESFELSSERVKISLDSDKNKLIDLFFKEDCSQLES